MIGLLKRSIAFKVISFVGLAMVVMFVVQSYVNITSFQNFITPLIVKNLDESLTRSKIVFDNLHKQTVEDAYIIKSHNALTNYLDYEQLDDQQGMNDELVELEQFLSALTASKPRYTDVEIFTSKNSIIRLQRGLVSEPNKFVNHRFLSDIPKADHVVTFDNELPVLGDQEDAKNIVMVLHYQFSAENDFIDGQGSNVVIRISSNIHQNLKELSDSLQSSNVNLLVLTRDKVIWGDRSETELVSNLWLTREFQDRHTGLMLAVSIKKSDAFLLVETMRNSIIVLALSLLLVVGLSQFITIRLLIANPLRKIVHFLKHHALKGEAVSVRYQTNSQDEIGVFATGLNHMLDQIQYRQSALKQSEERLALALWGSGEGLWEYDFDSQSIYLDSMSCQILGLTDNELRFDVESFAQGIHREDRDRVVKYFSAFLIPNNPLFEIEFKYAINDENVWLQLRGKVTKDKSGQGSSNLVIGTFRNITTQRGSEEQIRLYAKAFDSSGTAILILDKSLVVLAANEAFTNITGHQVSSVMGRIPDFIFNHRQSSFDIGHFTRQIDAEGIWQDELIGVKADNTQFIKDISINVILDSEQKPSHYVCAFSDITQKKKSEEDLWNMANHDILTGLPNRGYFRKTLSKVLRRAQKNTESVALLFVDLDRFKLVNDTLGHETGDDLLKAVAQILSKLARKSDSAARLGGDEFSVILEGIGAKEDVEKLVIKLLNQFFDGLIVNNKNTGVGLSIGISLFPNDTKDLDELVHFADTAMYFSKTNGTNLYHFFDPSMSDHVNRRNLLENELRVALEKDWLSLHFQPQLDAESGKVVSFEALSRWEHRDLGSISPEEFIPIAEDSGLIVQLGQQALVNACKQLKKWHEDGFSSLRMAINVSPKQFLLTDIAFDVTQVLNDIGLDASFIELELTESLIVDDPEKVTSMLNRLKALGVKLSIDDFGTGYSSLSYLSQFPLDVLKIDKSFINKITIDDKGLAITKAIMAIAKSLSLDVIAEGVETEEQLDILQRFGCQYVQGYFFSPPLPESKAYNLLGDYNSIQ